MERTDSDKEKEVSERDSVGVKEVVVDRDSDSGTQSEREGHPDRADAQGSARVLADDRHVDLETDDEQEQNEAW